jgi:predicted membrane protein (TIGR00267 family)
MPLGNLMYSVYYIHRPVDEVKSKMQNSETEKLFEEKRRIAKLSQIREIVFGTEDGLLVPLGVVSGVAGATTNNFYVLIAGLAEALAGSMSMGAGAYLSSKAEHEVQQWAISKEVNEVETIPEVEKNEIKMLFESEGLSAAHASKVADLVTASKKSWIRTMVEKELGLSMDPIHTGPRDALVIGLSYLSGSLFPIVPYLLLPLHAALVFSVGLTLAALFGLGVYKSRIAHGKMLKGGLEVMGIGAFSGLAGYALGTLMPILLRTAGIAAS